MIRHVILIAGALAAAAPALAQQPPAPRAAPAADPRQEAARPLYEGLPEADRKAVQDALVWTGDYNGVLDGTFGKRTFDALGAYAGRVGTSLDAVLQPQGRTALIAAAEKGKQAVRFTPTNDTRAGLRLGIPARLLAKVAPLPTGTSYRAEDGSVVLETKAFPAGTMLPDAYAAAAADAPGRKVTYRVLRPDFLVVTADEGDRTFYTRVAATPAGLKGYTFNYRKTRKDALSLAVAIANSFDPNPSPNPAPVQTATAPGTTAAPPSIASPPALPVATALLLSPGRAVTAADVLKACPSPRLAGAPVKVARNEGALALLEVPARDGAAGLGAASADTAVAGAPVLVLSMTRGAAASAPPALAVMPGTLVTGASGMSVRAALDNAPGSVVLDREGRLVGLVGTGPAPRRLGDVALAATYPLAGGAAVLALAGSAAAVQPAAATTAGTAAARLKDAIVALECR